MEVNVIGTIIFLVAVGTVGVTTLARIRADARADALTSTRAAPARARRPCGRVPRPSAPAQRP